MGLDTVELIIKVEEDFGISIPNEEAEKMLSVGDLYKFIVQRTAGSGPDPDEAWTRLKGILVEDFGIEPEAVTKEAWIVRDLGLD